MLVYHMGKEKNYTRERSKEINWLKRGTKQIKKSINMGFRKK